MRIAYDVTPLCVTQSGVGTYTANLLDHLLSSAEDEILPLAHGPLNGWEKRYTVHTPTNGWRWNKTIWMQTVLPWQLARLGMDVCHFTNNVASVWSPCPTIITLHDMTPWLFPEHHHRRRLLAMRPFVPLAAQRAAGIIAVSHATKADIVRLLKIPAEKIHVIYEAPAPCFRRIRASHTLESVRARYALPDQFVLAVGTIEPRKNLGRLIRAFARLRKHNLIQQELVLVGQRGWRDRNVFETVERMGAGRMVRFLGYVPHDDLVAIYNLADAVAFPSLYEGFGLPVVEAMACGTPVVTSHCSSLEEIAGDAAELVEPTHVESIAGGLRRVLTDADWHAELRARGLERAAQFSWAKAARQTRQVYRQVVM